MKVGRGGKSALPGAERGPASWPESLARYVLPGSLDVLTRCVSYGEISGKTTKRITGPNARVKGTDIGTMAVPLERLVRLTIPERGRG